MGVPFSLSHDAHVCGIRSPSACLSIAHSPRKLLPAAVADRVLRCWARVSPCGCAQDPLHTNHRDSTFGMYGQGRELPPPSTSPRKSALKADLDPDGNKNTSVDLPTEMVQQKGLHRVSFHSLVAFGHFLSPPLLLLLLTALQPAG